MNGKGWGRQSGRVAVRAGTFTGEDWNYAIFTGVNLNDLTEDMVAGDQEEAVRRDPEVQQARKIAAAARARLLQCVGGDDADALAEAQQMLDALRKATVLTENAEDRARVQLDLITQAEADRRAKARRASLEPPAAPRDTAPANRFAAPFALLQENPARAALLTLLVAAAAWFAARTLARRRRRTSM